MTTFYTDSGSFSDLDVTGSLRISGSLTLTSIQQFDSTGSLYGTASWANNAISASFATTASAATSITFTPATASFATTASYAVSAGTLLGSVTSASYALTSSYALTAETLLGSVTSASYAETASYALSALSASWAPGGEPAAGFPFSGSAIITGSLIVSGTTILGNRPEGIVLDPVNPETVFISASNINAVHVHGTINDYMQIESMNMSNGTNASADFVATADNGTELGNYIDLGINSSGYTGGIVGGASDGYLYLTSSVGELHVGHAGTTNTANVRLFAGGPNSDSTTRIFISSSGQVGIGTLTPSQTSTLHVQGNISASSITGSITEGGVTNIREMSMVVSGSFSVAGGNTITLNLNNANYFTITATGTGTITWVATNPPPTGRVQTFAIEYTNGGLVTNSWFSGIRWPGGVAPTLSSAGVDLLSFSTDDAGTTWRGVLLQRNSS